MKRIISAQFRQIFTGRLKWIVLVAFIVFGVIMAFLFQTYDESEFVEMSASQFVSETFLTLFSFSHMFISIVVAEMCAGDMNDKTLYIELMSGTTRTRAYYGRVISTVIFALSGCIIIFAVPTIVATMLYGWGRIMDADDFIIRVLLMILPIIRIICTYICFTFVLRNMYITMAFGYLGMSVTGLGLQLANAPAGILGVMSVKELMKVDSWMNFGFDGGDFVIHYVADSSVSAGLAANVTICSIVAAYIFLEAGRRYFLKDDLN